MKTRNPETVMTAGETFAWLQSLEDRVRALEEAQPKPVVSEHIPCATPGCNRSAPHDGRKYCGGCRRKRRER